MRQVGRWMAAMLAAVALGSVAVQADTTAEHDKRMGWWRDARFGMFIHWGLYSLPAGEWKGKKAPSLGEWIMNAAQIPVAEYEPLAKQFNPVKFNARQWVKIAKDAGVKYIVITSKHHDGFDMFDAANSDYDIVGTPFGRDVIKELSVACKAAGVRLCFYHSIMDWHHPDYLPRRPWDPRPGIEPHFDNYISYLKAQCKQLIQQYKPGIMWFDGEWESTWTHEMGLDLFNYCRSLDPNIIVNNRVDKGRQGMQGMTTDTKFAGDYGTPEQEVPADGLPGVDWESCMTMNGTWGFRKDDHNWKSAPDLIRMLVDIASKGGNFLLNVGPTSEGLIPDPSVERLAGMGQWMKANSESIYGTTASVIGRPEWGRCTVKPGRMYLHVFDWPADGTIVVEGVKGTVKSARLLSQKGVRIGVEQGGGKVTLRVPRNAPDAVDSVIRLEVAQ